MRDAINGPQKRLHQYEVWCSSGDPEVSRLRAGYFRIAGDTETMTLKRLPQSLFTRHRVPTDDGYRAYNPCNRQTFCVGTPCHIHLLARARPSCLSGFDLAHAPNRRGLSAHACLLHLVFYAGRSVSGTADCMVVGMVNNGFLGRVLSDFYCSVPDGVDCVAAAIATGGIHIPQMRFSAVWPVFVPHCGGPAGSDLPALYSGLIRRSNQKSIISSQLSPTRKFRSLTATRCSKLVPYGPPPLALRGNKR